MAIEIQNRKSQKTQMLIQPNPKMQTLRIHKDIVLRITKYEMSTKLGIISNLEHGNLMGTTKVSVFHIQFAHQHYL